MSIALGLVLLLGFSYAWFTLTLNGTKQNVIKVGQLSLVLTEGDAIKLENAIPTPVETGLNGSPYHFTVENKGNVDANYTLYLDNTGTITDPYMFYVALKKDGKLLFVDYLGSIDHLFMGTIKASEKSEYDLYIWLDYNDDGSTIADGQYYEGTLRIESSQQKERKLFSAVKHACDGQTNCTREVGSMTYFWENYYTSPTSQQFVWYSGNLWLITSYDSDGNMKAISSKELVSIPWGSTLDYKGSYVETWINEEFLPTLNNYQKFLVTDYPWNYSDEIEGSGYSDSWTIGTDKIVKGPVGLLNKDDLYYASDQNGIFNGGDVFLSQVGSYYYMATTLVSGKKLVGGMGYINSGSGYTLNNSRYAGISPAIVFKKDVTVISGSGTQEDPYRLKGDESGAKGELLNTRNIGEYVAFGEGLNHSYRISQVENGLTKLTTSFPLIVTNLDSNGETLAYLVSSNSTFTSSTYFYNMNYIVNSADSLLYDSTSSNYPLAYFLNHNFLSSISGYFTSDDISMIATSQTWHLGTVTKSDHYQNAKNTSKHTVATVGLPRLDERIGDLKGYDRVLYISNLRQRSLFLTNDGTKPLLTVSFSSGAFVNVFPMFYLKNNVKIKSGSGTRNDPYILMME